MRTGLVGRRKDAKQLVLNELKQLAADRNPRNKTLLARFIRCPDLQVAALSIARAVDAEQRAYSATPLTPPPGWLPPLA